MTDLKPSVVVNLSVDELAFMMRALNIPRLASFIIPEDFDQIASGIAGRSLQARGLIIQEDDKYLLERHVAGMVAACAFFKTVIAITYTSEAIRETHWFYLSSPLAVHHHVSATSAHVLQTIPDGMSMLLLIASALHLRPENVASVETQNFYLSKELWENIREKYIHDNNNEIYETVLRAGFDEALAMGLAYPVSRSAVSIVHPENGSYGLMIAQHEDKYWLVRPGENEDIVVETADVAHILDTIAGMVQPVGT